MKAILNHFGIDEKFTAPVQKPKFYNKIKDNIPLIQNFNQMCDILYLPETKEKFKYLLVVVDLASELFDIQPLRGKTSEETLQALEKIYKRGILKPPKGSMSSDNGSEFKGVFHKYLYDKNIFHKMGIPYRHQQSSMVENLNKQLARIFMGYLNKKELQSKQSYHEWTDILDEVRKKLNFYRRNENIPKDITTYEYPVFNPSNKPIKPIKDKNKTDNIDIAFGYKPILKKKEKFKSKLNPILEEPEKEPEINNEGENESENEDNFEEPKFKVGDRVYVKLEIPYNVLGHKETTTNFRVGDMRWSKEIYKIKKIIYMNTNPWYRYLLDRINNCSYSKYELKLATHQKDETYIFKSIVGHKKINRIRYYKIWYKGELKKDASYQKENQLIEDNLCDEINEYKTKNKLKNNW